MDSISRFTLPISISSLAVTLQMSSWSFQTLVTHSSYLILSLQMWSSHCHCHSRCWFCALALLALLSLFRCAWLGRCGSLSSGSPYSVCVIHPLPFFVSSRFLEEWWIQTILKMASIAQMKKKKNKVDHAFDIIWIPFLCPSFLQKPHIDMKRGERWAHAEYGKSHMRMIHI